jgi:hypothetical protein
MAKGTIERAIELAREGNCRTVDDIRRTLAEERFSNVKAHTAGAGIRRQLKELMQGARAASAGDQPTGSGF